MTTWRTLVLLSGLAAGCIGVNPDYDDAGAETGDGGESAPETSLAETAEDSASDDGGTASGSGGVAESCTSLGLALCESDGQRYCADLLEDDMNCGACFNACQTLLPGSSCDEGMCECPGGGDWKVCGGRCAKTRDDPTACGDACVDCRAHFGPMAECRGGECRSEDDDDDGDD